MVDHIDESLDMYVYGTTSRRVAIVQGTAGVLSCVTAGTLFIYLSFMTLRPVIQRRFGGVATAIDGSENTTLKTQVSLFLMALFASDMFQSLCGMMQIRWASHGGVALHSAACRAQGVALLAGDLGVCYFNVVMAVQTFWTIIMRRTISGIVTTLIILSGFVFAIVFSLVGPYAIATDAKGTFYGIAGIWCFITNDYSSPRVWLHYFPIYISVFLLIVIYSSVFWKLRQTERSRQRAVTLSQRGTVLDENPALRTHYHRVANKLLWYPATYLVLILPISIARVIQIGGTVVPEGFLDFAITLLMLSGFFNGIIYMFTRQALSPFSSWSPQRKADISFLKRRKTTEGYAVWVTQEREQADDKLTLAIELQDGAGHGKTAQYKHQDAEAAYY